MAKIEAPPRVSQSPAPPAAAAAAQLVIPAAANVAEVPSVYANTIEILSMNHIDVRIAFNEIIIESGNQPTLKRRANIVMPTQAFMMALQILTVNSQILAANLQKQADQAQALFQAQIAEAMAKQQAK